MNNSCVEQGINVVIDFKPKEISKTNENLSQKGVLVCVKHQKLTLNIERFKALAGDLQENLGTGFLLVCSQQSFIYYNNGILHLNFLLSHS